MLLHRPNNGAYTVGVGGRLGRAAAALALVTTLGACTDAPSSRPSPGSSDGTAPASPTEGPAVAPGTSPPPGAILVDTEPVPVKFVQRQRFVRCRAAEGHPAWPGVTPAMLSCMRAHHNRGDGVEAVVRTESVPPVIRWFRWLPNSGFEIFEHRNPRNETGPPLWFYENCDGRHTVRWYGNSDSCRRTLLRSFAY